MILTLTWFNKQDFLSDTSAGLGEILILIIKDILSQRYNLYYLLNVCMGISMKQKQTLSRTAAFIAKYVKQVQDKQYDKTQTVIQHSKTQ